MKKMKKFLIAFCMILAFSASAVYADDASDYYSQLTQTASEEDTVKQSAQSYMSAFASMTLDDAEYYKENATGYLQVAAASYYTYLENDTLGDFVELKDTEVKETKKGYNVVCTGEFENVNLKMKVTYMYIGGQITPTDITFSTEENHPKSLGEKLADAGLNTIIGLITVFAILILISFIISLFKYIPMLEEKMAKRKASGTEVIASVENVTSQIEEKEELADDSELVAVITAAICAATGTSSDGFVVRSIRKSKRKFD